MDKTDSSNNGKIAIICPGQGSQTSGGITSLPQSAKGIFDRASSLIGMDLWEAGLKSNQTFLAKPSFLQPFLVAWAVSELAAAREKDIQLPEPDFVLGHSSGENSALVISGAVEFEDAIEFASQRGILLERACLDDSTSLIAIAGIGRETVEDIAQKTHLHLANYNAADQLVLGGHSTNIKIALRLAETLGGRATILRVAGAFHSPFFESADKNSLTLIDALRINTSFIPMIGNARGQLIKDSAGIRDELNMQFTRPIEWVESLQTAYTLGVRTVIVTGPGNAMAGLVRRFSRHLNNPISIIRL